MTTEEENHKNHYLDIKIGTAGSENASGGMKIQG